MALKSCKRNGCALYLYSQVPEHFREPYITGGYRNPESTFKECLKSLISNNNETLNCWTHYASALLFLGHFYLLKDVSPNDVTGATLVPMKVLVFGACVYALASASAHTFNTMSLPARHICFFVDYAGLSFYSFTAASAGAAYSLPAAWKRPGPLQLYGRLFLSGSFLMACFCIVVSCSSRFMRPSFFRKLFRLSAFALPYLYDCIPFLWRTFVVEESNKSFEALRFHQWQFLLAVLAVLFYVSHFPERKYPGRFDIFGHSHQWFHLCSFFATHFQIKAVLIDHIAQDSYNPHFPKDHQLLQSVTTLVVFIVAVVIVFAFFANRAFAPANFKESQQFQNGSPAGDAEHKSLFKFRFNLINSNCNSKPTVRRKLR